MPTDEAGVSQQLSSLSNWAAGAKASGRSSPHILLPLGASEPSIPVLAPHLHVQILSLHVYLMPWVQGSPSSTSV